MASPVQRGFLVVVLVVGDLLAAGRVSALFSRLPTQLPHPASSEKYITVTAFFVLSSNSVTQTRMQTNRNHPILHFVS